MSVYSSSFTFKTPSGDELSLGDGSGLFFIAGPCAIEGRDMILRHAERLAELRNRLAVPLIFKSSFDKANRTSLSSYRGIGIIEGLKILAEVREQFLLPIITDVHLPEQVPPVAEVADILQIPAFLCRQTDLLCAAGGTGRVILVKKGQFLAPEDMQLVAAKVASTGNRRIIACERGACFGYRELIVDMRSLVVMRSLGLPVVFDATHSVQIMGGTDGKSGGAREYIKPLARAAVAVGVDGVFLECHEDPASAKSDSASMLQLDQVEPLMRNLLKIHTELSDDA